MTVTFFAVSVIPILAQDSVVVIDDFVGMWTSKVKQDEQFYGETKITKISNGIEVEGTAFLGGDAPIIWKAQYYLDGRGNSNLSPSGDIEQSTTEFKRDTITIAFFYIDKKTGKSRKTNFKKYRLLKGKLIITTGVYEYFPGQSLLPLEVKMIKKP